jgi:lysophospholipase L1-like esterase
VPTADNQAHLYAWDASTSETGLLAADVDVKWEDFSNYPDISADGKFVSFYGSSESHPAPDSDEGYTSAFDGSSAPMYVTASGGGKPGTGKNINKYGSESNVRYGSGAAWVNWACSGAVTANVLPISDGGVIQNDDGRREKFTQLDNPSVNYATDTVTITIGGNDAQFSDILTYCALHACNTTDFRDTLNARIDALLPRLRTVYDAVKAKTYNADIYVVGYPQAFPESSDEQGCTKLKPWRGEQDMLRQAATRLNGVIKTAAKSANVTYVPVDEDFAGHEVCGGKGEWLNGPSFTVKSNRKFLDDESFHPNLEGQYANGYATIVKSMVH